MKMMLRRQLKRSKFSLPPEKEAGKVLEGETDEQVKELVSLLKTEAKVL